MILSFSHQKALYVRKDAARRALQMPCGRVPPFLSKHLEPTIQIENTLCACAGLHFISIGTFPVFPVLPPYVRMCLLIYNRSKQISHTLLPSHPFSLAYLLTSHAPPPIPPSLPSLIPLRKHKRPLARREDRHRLGAHHPSLRRRLVRGTRKIKRQTRRHQAIRARCQQPSLPPSLRVLKAIEAT